MLSKLIENHVEAMDSIEEKVEKDIDQLIGKIDVDALMEDPEGELLILTEALSRILEEEYFEKAIDKGVEFGEKIKKLSEEEKKIKIDGGKDPNKNEGLFDDKRTD